MIAAKEQSGYFLSPDKIHAHWGKAKGKTQSGIMQDTGITFQRNLGNSLIQSIAQGSRYSGGQNENSNLSGTGKTYSYNNRTCCPGKSSTQSKIQTKLIIGSVNDASEREADRISDQITRMPDSMVIHGSYFTDTKLNLQRSPYQANGGEVTGSDMQINQSGSRPLSESTRRFMEPRFGVNFSNVRLHDDKASHEKAFQIRAKAFTYGNHIYLGEGIAEGDKGLMAHELTHVLQQAHTNGLNRIQRFTTDDCSQEYGDELQLAYINAQNAIPRVASKLLNPSASDRRTYASIFGTNNAVSIGLRLYLIRQGLQSATAQCENPDGLLYNFFCGNAIAYVRPVPAFFGIGDIHVCQPGFHNLSETQQMATLIHEGAHRYLGADDEAYYTLNCNETADTRGLDDSDRWDNADCYGCLVQQLG